MDWRAKIAICFSVIVLWVSCKDDKDFSPIPQIENRETTKVDSSTFLWRIGFKDGDGDLGVLSDDDPDNFIVDIYSINDGKDSLIPSNNYRIPVIESVKTADGVEGEFKFTIDNLDLFALSDIDSIYMSGYVVDRAGNNSNILYTPRFRVN
jgi:hypothetical protein